VHWLDEVDVVHCRGDDVGPRVTVSCHGAGQSIKCIRRPREDCQGCCIVGRMISVISDCVLATVRTIGLVLVELIASVLHSFTIN